MKIVAKSRHNFTLSPDAIEKLKDVDNKSQFVEEAVVFYHANKDKKQEIAPRLAFHVKEIKI